MIHNKPQFYIVILIYVLRFYYSMKGNDLGFGKFSLGILA